MKKIISALVFALLATTSFSQSRSIKGIVQDSSSKEELIVAVVYVKGTHHSTFTQLDGTFKINIPDSLKNGTLVFQLISYKAIERQITEQDFSNKLTIYLKHNNTLNEVVVTEVDKESE